MSRSFVHVFFNGSLPNSSASLTANTTPVNDHFWECPVSIGTDKNGVHLKEGGDLKLYGPVATGSPMTPACKDTPVFAAAFCLVMCGDELLVVQKKKGGMWFPPGGMLETNESLEDACRREVHEETGVDIDNMGPAFAYESMMERNGAIERHNLMMFFKGTSAKTSLNITDTDEIAAAKWVTREEFCVMDTTPGMRFCISRWWQ